MEVTFTAQDYTREDTFIQSEYRFSGDSGSGWTITRNGREHLALGPGHRLLQTEYCGICSTDLARRFLPFPLPQVIGHEAVACDDKGRRYVIEINDTCTARGDAHPEIFCRSGLPTHCPGRMVLGIDRLPGGFGPWMLVPVNAAVPADGLPPRSAVLVEPFAAALHAVSASPPRSGDAVAVVGSGRLGLLIIAALHAFRTNSGTRLTVNAIGQNSRNFERARSLGAYDTVVLNPGDAARHGEQYDLVYDATGSPEGLDTAIALARREVHLKSTHGQEYRGIRHLTELVVDELALLPYSTANLGFCWEGESRRNEMIFTAPGAEGPAMKEPYRIRHDDYQSAQRALKGNDFSGRLPRFDIAIASTPAGIDGCIRPSPANEESLVRPRGAILFRGDDQGHPLLRFLNAGKCLRTTRCGDFRKALAALKKNSTLLSLMEEHLITHEFPADRIPEAYDAAKTHAAVKVIIKHEHS